jgi:hypothetical protein
MANAVRKATLRLSSTKRATERAKKTLDVLKSFNFGGSCPSISVSNRSRLLALVTPVILTLTSGTYWSISANLPVITKPVFRSPR